MQLRNRLSLITLALGASLFAAACGNDQPEVAAPPTPMTQAVTPASCTPSDVDALMLAAFPDIDARFVMRQRFTTIVSLMNGGPDKAPNPAAAQTAAINLIDFILLKFRAGKAIGGQAGAFRVAAVINGVLCFVGLPPFDPDALGPDGAAAVILPTSGRSLVVTPSLHAGVDVPAGNVTTPILLTVTRLPNTPGPLLTQLDQYGLYYQFHTNPAITFNNNVVVALCIPDDIGAPDFSRLRLAHNVAPFTMGSIEILDLVAAPFVDCSNVNLSAAPSSGRLNDLARGGFNLVRSTLTSMVTPQPLMAAVKKFGGSGIGGSVRTFSPFGAVDTLGIMTAVGNVNKTTEFGNFVDVAPAVRLTTPTGAPMVGVPVTFAVTAGNGQLGSSNVLTDATGLASSVSWQIGFTNPNTVSATATATPRSGFAGSPTIFNAIGF